MFADGNADISRLPYQSSWELSRAHRTLGGVTSSPVGAFYANLNKIPRWIAKIFVSF
jgi:hypothetical protein